MVGPPPTEQEMVERARTGDAHAYAQLVREHQEVAFRTAYLITGDAADAEEAAQDGFVKAYAALDRFRPGEPLRPWLLTIVANEARNRRTAAGRRTRLWQRVAVEQPPDDPFVGAPSPEAVLLSGERRERLLAALSTLREDDRRVIVCRYVLDLSERETAVVLDCRRGTVKSRLSRALERLRAELGEEGDGDE